MNDERAGEANGAVDLSLRAEVTEMIIEALAIEEVTLDSIDPDAPIFGDGLGLTSIDALEIAFVVEQNYGLKLRSDDEQNHKILASLNNLTRHIAVHRTK